MGWLGALLALVHPIKPNVITGFVTIIGLILWFLSGFVALAWVVFNVTIDPLQDS